MNHKPLFSKIPLPACFALSIGFSVLFTLLALSAHQAYAASCFTDTGGHWAESFICWMQTTGLSSGYPDGTFRPNNYITRAEVASLLYKEASGDTYVNLGPTAWQVEVDSYASAYIDYLPAQAELRSYATGGNYYEASIPLITTLHNQQMTAKGAKLSYNAAATGGGSIIAVYVQLNNGSGSPVDSTSNITPRTDSTCRVYTLASPEPLAGPESLVILIETDLATTSDAVEVYSATAIQGFTPTAGVLAPSPSIPGPVPGTAP